jgi:hypothetical protein
MWFRLRDTESNDPLMWPRRQLPSMKRMIEAWFVRVLSTKLARAHGEMTSSGSRGPKPHRPSWPPSDGPLPQAPVPVSASAALWEGLVMPLKAWSYQPSESS